MCGVAAIFNYGSSSEHIDFTELCSMRDYMSSRGPDSAGAWVDEKRRIGLGHRRLAIIDLSPKGAQPMSTLDSKVRIVFNGEIYNYIELRQDLELKGHTFSSTTDTEVILYLYKEYGKSLVNHLRGMFAFVIWDELKQGILVARDHFGIKPIYYSDNGKTIRIASQVKALLKSSSKFIDTSIEPAGHVGFYTWGHVPEPFTLYKGVRALEAGCTLWIDVNGNSTIERFFSISSVLSYQKEDLITSKLQFQELQYAMRDSISHHLISDVPVGIFLSSGLDSATILALATEAGNKNMQSFTLGFEEFKGTINDETILAKKLANSYGAKHSMQMIQKKDFLDNLEHLYNVMDQPTIDGVKTYFVCKGANETGIKVVLSGLGGDELFAGYNSFNEIPKLTDKLKWAESMPALGRGFRYISSPILKHLTSPKYASLLEYGGSVTGAYLLRRGLFMPWELPKLLDGEIVKKGWADLNTLSNLKHTISGIDNSRLQISALEISWYMKNQLLRDNDWASMAFSLELRIPLVDIKLFKTVSKLVRSGYKCTKQDMASTPNNSLPESILNRKKTGFSIPVKNWMKDSITDKVNFEKRGLRGWATEVFNKNLSLVG